MSAIIIRETDTETAINRTTFFHKFFLCFYVLCYDHHLKPLKDIHFMRLSALNKKRLELAAN